MTKKKFQSQRYLGLDLAGAKNRKTTLAAIEYYSKEEKIFLIDISTGIGPDASATGDEVLLEVVSDSGSNISQLGVNAPLDLPPCVSCTRKTCPLPKKCSVPSVRWMRQVSKKASFTPYTQRPFEVWMRHHLMPKLDQAAQFDIDEALGGNKAPLTARMHFLQFHLSRTPIVEVWPKLTVALLAPLFKVRSRTLSKYRSLEDGAAARSEILEAFADHCDIFIYDRDLRKLSASLSCFDAFIAAYTALLSHTGHCDKIPKGFPKQATWVQFPSS